MEIGALDSGGADGGEHLLANGIGGGLAVGTGLEGVRGAVACLVTTLPQLALSAAPNLGTGG